MCHLCGHLTDSLKYVGQGKRPLAFSRVQSDAIITCFLSTTVVHTVVEAKYKGSISLSSSGSSNMEARLQWKKNGISPEFRQLLSVEHVQ